MADLPHEPITKRPLHSAEMNDLVDKTELQVGQRLHGLLESALQDGKAATLLRLDNDKVVITQLELGHPSILAGTPKEKYDPVELRFKGLLGLLALVDLRALTDDMISKMAQAAGVEMEKVDDPQS